MRVPGQSVMAEFTRWYKCHAYVDYPEGMTAWWRCVARSPHAGLGDTSAAPS